MCGIAGFAGVGVKHRITLARTLGNVIDKRGGHGAGYLAVAEDSRMIRHWRTLTKFQHASRDFSSNLNANALTSDLTLMHSRFATCGKRTLDEVHPFSIERNGKVVLLGCHNGIIDNARESAATHDRPYSVDSLELLHLLADEAYDDIAKLEGYGTLAWIESKNRNRIKFVKLSEDASLEVVQVQSGGFVFGSTHEIIDHGVKLAGLQRKHHYNLETGVVYSLTPENLYISKDHPKIVLAQRWSQRRWDDAIDDTWTLEEESFFDGEEMVWAALEFGMDPINLPYIRGHYANECGLTEAEIDAVIKQVVEDYRYMKAFRERERRDSTPTFTFDEDDNDNDNRNAEDDDADFMQQWLSARK